MCVDCGGYLIKKCCFILNFCCYTSQKMARARTTKGRTRRTFRQTRISFSVVKQRVSKKVQALEKAKNKVLKLPAPSDEPSDAQGVEVVEKIGDLDLHESGQWEKAGLTVLWSGGLFTREPAGGLSVPSLKLLLVRYSLPHALTHADLSLCTGSCRVLWPTLKKRPTATRRWKQTLGSGGRSGGFTWSGAGLCVQDRGRRRARTPLAAAASTSFGPRLTSASQCMNVLVPGAACGPKKVQPTGTGSPPSVHMEGQRHKPTDWTPSCRWLVLSTGRSC